MTKINLKKPIGKDDKIKAVTIREPSTGECRGINFGSLASFSVDEYEKLLPRITSPILHANDIRSLSMADSMKMMMVVVDFLDLQEDSQAA